MKNSLSDNLRHLLPAWITCIFLPLPFIIFPDWSDNGWLPFLCFFVSCAGLVAYSFRPDINSERSQQPKRTWRLRITTSGIALFSASIVFFLFRFFLNSEHDFLPIFLTVLGVIPPLCIAPYLTIITRKPFAATVFTFFLVFCMKLLGCVVVVLIYGWHADAHGYTDMPWTQPNLLVWLFWFNTGVLSLSFYILGKRKFLRNMTLQSDASLNFAEQKN